MVKSTLMKTKEARMREELAMAKMYINGFDVPHIAWHFEMAEHTVRVRLKGYLATSEEVYEFKRDYAQVELTRKQKLKD
jgi:hypothetical protein